MLTACATGIFALTAFGETNVVNSVSIIREGDNRGKLDINVNLTALSTRKITVDVKDIHSVIDLESDHAGSDESGDNLLEVTKYIDQVSGQEVEERIMLRLPADAFRDSSFMDWILSDKQGEGELADDFHNLLTLRHQEGKSLYSNQLAVVTGKQPLQIGASHEELDRLIDKDDSRVEEKLQALEQRYGKEYLENLENGQLYNLFKKHY